MPQKPFVLMVTTDRQIDRRTLQQADSLENNGWEVVILAMPKENDELTEDARVVRINAKSNSKSKNSASMLFIVYSLFRSALAKSTALRKCVKYVTWRYFLNPKTFYLNLFSPYLTQYDPDVVVAIDLPTLPVASAIANLCQAKLIYDSHELYSEQEFSPFEKKKWEELEAEYIKKCNVVITINSSVATELQKRHNLKNINIIYNSINKSTKGKNPTLFHSLFSLPQNSKVLLFQGGLTKNRHLDALIQAMSIVQNKNIHLVMLGNGQIRTCLEKLAYSHNVIDRVHFHPAVPQEELLEYTQAADAGIIPYQATCLNNLYCTPNKLFEFIAAGVPLLANNLPEINIIVNNQQIGLTGVMDTAINIAHLIDNFFSDEQRIDQWNANLLAAQDEFCWTKEEQKLVRIFEGIS